MTDDSDAAGEHDVSKPFLDHLEDLRGTLIKSATALFLGVLICIPFCKPLMNILLAPLRKTGVLSEDILISNVVTEAFTSALKLALWGGVILSFPFIVYFVGQFVFPGLKAVEKKIIYRCSGFVIVLFAAGVAMGYFLTLPVALKLMMWWNDYMGIKAQWKLQSYLLFCTQLILAFGLVFQMPVIILLLGKMGLITSVQLRKYRRHMIVVMLVVAAILTPPDVFSQLLMGVPLILLYEICIWILKGMEGKSDPGLVKKDPETKEPAAKK